MQICRSLAGYSYAHADIVRRAMSKKKTSAMQAEREGFVQGCAERGVSEADANAIFDEMVGFAKYAFNKSHATAYGVLSYRTAYLKAHYPAEYFTALMSSVLGNVGDIKAYIDDAKNFRVSVLAPDINESDADFTVVDGNIRFGLLAIKNVGRQFADALVRCRGTSPYKSFDDFVTRMSGSELNKRTVESLIKCGVFDSLGTPRSALLATFEGIIEAEHEKTRNNVSGQMDLFSVAMGTGTDISASGYDYPDLPEFGIKDLLMLEKESSGMYFSGHLIDSYSEHISEFRTDSIAAIIDDLDPETSSDTPTYRDKSEVRIAGLITAKKTKVTKNGETMAFLTVEDRVAEIEVVVFAKHYARLSSILNVDAAVIIIGNISQEDDDAPRILLSSAEELRQNGIVKTPSAAETEMQDGGTVNASSVGKPEGVAGAVNTSAPAGKPEPRLFIKVDGTADPRISIIYRTAQFNRGTTQVIIYDMREKKYSVMKGITLDPSEKVLKKLGDAFGTDSVILK